MSHQSCQNCHSCQSRRSHQNCQSHKNHQSHQSYFYFLKELAAKHNCHQALWLFGPDQEITEVGSMNIFALFQQANSEKLELVTPPLESGLILPGVTRRSVLELARDSNEFDVNERKLTIKEILNAAQEGTLVEMFGTGTAAIVTPVGNIFYDGIMNPLPIPEADKSFAQR